MSSKAAPGPDKVKRFAYTFNSGGMTPRVIEHHIRECTRALAARYELPESDIVVEHVPRQIDGADFRLTAYAGVNRTNYAAAILAAKTVLPRLRAAQAPDADAQALRAAQTAEDERQFQAWLADVSGHENWQQSLSAIARGLRVNGWRRSDRKPR